MLDLAMSTDAPTVNNSSTADPHTADVAEPAAVAVAVAVAVEVEAATLAAATLLMAWSSGSAPQARAGRGQRAETWAAGRQT